MIATRLKPFSGNYQYNYRRLGGRGPDCEPCAHCGKPVRKPFRWHVEVIPGDSAYAYVRRDDNPEILAAARSNEASYMGMYPVGPECRKLLESDGVRVLRFTNEII